MSGTIESIPIYIGASHKILLTFRDKDLIVNDDTLATHNPEGLIDLTPFTVEVNWRKSLSSAVVLARTSATPGEIDKRPQTALPFIAGQSTLGQADLFYAEPQTALLSPGTYFVDAWLINGAQKKIGIRPTPFPLLGGVRPVPGP